MSGMSNFVYTVFVVSLLTLFSGCSKLGDSLGIDIPEDNIIDEKINEAIYYPIRDQMCEWGFRNSGCVEENTTSKPNVDGNVSNETNTTTCPSGYTLTDGTCVDSSGSKLKDVLSKWFDILTTEQQALVQKDKNNINQNNKDLTAITLLDNLTNGKLLMKKNTKVVLPYYIYNTKVESQIAITKSSDSSIVKSNLIDSSDGTFKIVDSNSIVFLELSALGNVDQNASINLKVQETDGLKYDEETLNVSIVDDNWTYNPVSLFFTYKTIMIEEGDSRNIYFGISYTIDSNVTVAVRSDIDKIMSGTGTTLDLTTSVNNNIVSTYISNEAGVPSYFKLDAKGEAGDTMELYLVARDSQGNFDFQKFNVLIVAKGQGSYVSDGNTSTGTDSNTSTILIGNDWDLLSATKQTAVNNDKNNINSTDTSKPVITIFDKPTTLKIPQGKTVSTSFYVKDSKNASIYTIVYDDINKVKANMLGYGKYTVTYSNKLFYLSLEGVGKIGDKTTVTIYSQNQNNATQYDQETIDIEIVDPNDTGTVITPEILFGYQALYIEENGSRDGLTFYTSSSANAVATGSITDTQIATFDWIKQTTGYYQFKVTAKGKSGDKTSLSIKLVDGNVEATPVLINIYIIGIGELGKYIDLEQNNSNTDNNNSNTTPITCQTGYHAVGSTCVIDTNTTTCQTGYHLEGSTCIKDTNNSTNNIENNSTDTNTTTCQTGYHLEGSTCVVDEVNVTCPTGTYLKDGLCVSLNGDTNVTPSCQTGYHLSDGKCVADEVTPTCSTGYTFKNGQCVSNSDGTTIPPICEVGYKLENGVCVTNPVCNDGYHLENGSCIIDIVECGTGFTEINGTCVKNETNTTDDRNTSTIPYDQWTDKEKAEKSIEICFLKINETGYVTLNAPTILAEGYSNTNGTIILHSQKASVINGVAQNVSITMVYKEVATAKSTNKFLDATYTVPKFRVDYTVDYANGTFYIIDNGNGKCYVNTFPADGAIPFGVLELVKPEDLPTN